MAGILNDIRNEFSKTNNMVVKLILVNVIVFLAVSVLYILCKLGQSDNVYDVVLQQLGLSANIQTVLFKPWTILVNFFIHENVWHILFNMLFLYWFGQLLEEYIGSRRMFSLYILGGIVGGIFFLFIYNLLPYFQPKVADSVLIGASGAIFAIIVGAATLLPDYTFFIFLLGPVRIKYIAAFYVVLSMIELAGTNAGGNLAHLAGAFVGYMFIKMLRKGTDLGSPIVSIIEICEQLFSKRSQKTVRLPERRTPTTANVYKQSASYSSPHEYDDSPEVSSAPNQEEIDTILDKISKSGYDSLTREEKQILYRASQQD